jgi:hypothetical protein
VIAVADRPLPEARLVAIEGDERRRLRPAETWGSLPWGWVASVAAPEAGAQRFCLVVPGDGRPDTCVDVDVLPEAADPPDPPAGGIWTADRDWDRGFEAFYAAWIARLFLVEPGMAGGWRPLHKVTRDPSRNLLHGHLGLGEDDAGSTVPAVLAPDCGDAPYFLRAYFAWKLGLPFAAHLCLRGTPGEGPICDGRVLTHASTAWDHVPDPVERFNRFLGRTAARLLHSGTLRTLPEDERSDSYPLPLSRAALRPGTVFVDPRGHILVLTRWLPGAPDRIGTLYAIDGHPDESISHKRFSPSAFFFSPRLRTGGFKAFRPIRREAGGICFVSNAELQSTSAPRPLSGEQYVFPDAAAYYALLDGLLNPDPPDPALAFRTRAEILVESLADREQAIRTAVDHMEANGWARIPMPSGPEIFTTSGPWEQYASPGRDLRLLVAFDEWRAFPERVSESPGSFRLAPDADPEALRARLDAVREESLALPAVTYRRSDGSPFTLTLADLLARLDRFEIAYNPNDCPEVRWGAAEGTEEYEPCGRRAPSGQQRSMAGYRPWFAARRQPAPPPPLPQSAAAAPAAPDVPPP